MACLFVVGCSSNKQTAKVQPKYSQPDAILDGDAKSFNKRMTPETHIAAAQLAESQDRADAAAEQYRKALQIEPDNTTALYGLARLFTVKGQFDQAIPAWERYVRATNDDPTAWNNLARCYELNGQWNDAEASYLRSLQKNPDNKQTQVNYGLMLAKRDRIEESRQWLSKNLPACEVEYNLASVYEIRGKIQMAREHYQAALVFDPKFKEAQQRLDRMESLSTSAQ
ncbi:MAG TPA: tetratricopeptide repeat protein [Tepidisphaeraceae bacterium]|nr:tetratricopeptide repeat protein [Tepidisphaeraceae bacterium]